MVMVMAMVMGEISMTRKRNSLIILTAFGLLLTGCSKSGLEISKSDILEVARDDANATKSECENVSIKEQKGIYIVTFNTSGGSYVYKIGKDGIIIDRKYKLQTNEEVKTSETKEESYKKNENEKDDDKSLNSFNKNEEKAINSVLVNAGLEQDDISDTTCTLDESSQQYTVTFVLNGVTNTCVVDANTFTVLSTIVG